MLCEKDRYVIPKRFYGKGAKGDKVYNKLTGNKPPTGRTSQAYEKMLYNAIHVAVAYNHGVTLVKSLVGKRKREDLEETQIPVEEKEENVVVCDGQCAKAIEWGFFLPCGHRYCVECLKYRDSDVHNGFCFCGARIPEGVLGLWD